MSTQAFEEDLENEETEHDMIFEDEVLEIIEPDLTSQPQIMEEEEDTSDEEMEIDQTSTSDHSSSRFKSHTSPIFHVSHHPILPHLCASGGADDLGYLWDSRTGLELMKLTGHQESVCSLKFSHDGRFLASASVDGLIKIWSSSDLNRFDNWNLVIDLEGSDEVTVSFA